MCVTRQRRKTKLCKMLALKEAEENFCTSSCIIAYAKLRSRIMNEPKTKASQVKQNILESLSEGIVLHYNGKCHKISISKVADTKLVNTKRTVKKYVWLLQLYRIFLQCYLLAYCYCMYLDLLGDTASRIKIE